MDILQDRYLIVGKKVSSFLGVWPAQVYRERIFFNCIVGSMLIYSILIQFCLLFTMDFNLRSIILVLEVFIPMVCATSLYYACILHFLTLQKLFARIVQDCLRLKGEIELKIMQKYVNECKLFAMISGCLSYLFLFFYICPSIVRIVRARNEIIDSKQSSQIFGFLNHFLRIKHYYHPLLIYEILSAFTVTTVAVISFSTYFWFIQHACARLCIIKSTIHQLFENDKHKDNILEKPLDLSSWTVDLIQRLSRTREFTALVNKLSEKCYLFNMSLGFLLTILDFLCVSLTLIGLLLQRFHVRDKLETTNKYRNLKIPILMQHKETREDTVAFIVFVFDTFFPIYLNCFVGQRLMDYSNDVYQEMCLIPIHEISLKTQKLLLTTLMMNTRPCTISIGKMFVSSHEFFGDLIRMAFSFAMMLHSTGHI